MEWIVLDQDLFTRDLQVATDSSIVMCIYSSEDGLAESLLCLEPQKDFFSFLPRLNGSLLKKALFKKMKVLLNITNIIVS